MKTEVCFWNNLKRYGESPALISAETASILTYNALDDAVERIADGFSRHPRTTVLTPLNNSADDIIRYLGLLRAAHVPLLYSSHTSDAGLKALISKYEPGIVIGPAVRLCHVANSRYAANGQLESAHLLDSARGLSLFPLLSLLISTSGSTGSPKLVRLSASNLNHAAEQVRAALNIQQHARTITSVPLSHIYGLSMLQSYLVGGGSLVVEHVPVLDKRFWDTFRKYSVNSISGVPWTYQMLRSTGLRASTVPSLTTITTTGGKLDKQTAVWMGDTFAPENAHIYYMYGQTEACGRISVLPSNLRTQKIGSVGQAVPGGSLRCESDGSIIYCGPNVMLGYANTPADLTKGDDLKGELVTGDLGHCDSDGFLYLTGRSSRVAKLYGIRVNLDEVQQYIADCGIAAVVLSDDLDKLTVNCCGVSEAETVSLAREIGRAFKIPVSAVSIAIVQTDRVARSESGKLLMKNVQSRGECNGR